MQHKAEVVVEKRVTLTLSGKEFDQLLALAMLGQQKMVEINPLSLCGEQRVYGKPISLSEARDLTISLRTVENDLRKQFNVYAEGRVYAL